MEKGKLFLIATPIGNLEDITLRAIQTIKDIDYLYCEDTRESRILLNHYKIKKALRAYHKHNERTKASEIIEYLEKGQNVGLLADRGTPLISDPGSILVQECIKFEIEIIPIPGATAFLQALIVSGWDIREFLFIGFLEEKSEKRKKQLKKLENYPFPLIFYVSPKKIAKQIAEIEEILGNREIIISREITKLHEEHLRGTIKQLKPKIDKIKGEIVLLVQKKEIKAEISELEIKKMIDFFLEEKISVNEAIKKTAQELNMNKNKIYKIYHEL